MRVICIVLVALVLAIGTTAIAAVVNLGASDVAADGYLFQRDNVGNFTGGLHSYEYVKTGFWWGSLIKFDLSGINTTGWTSVDGATLTLNVHTNYEPTWTNMIDVYRMDGDWDTNADWLTKDGTNAWDDTWGWGNTGPDGSINQTATDSVYVGGTGDYSWDITSLVDDWLLGGTPNYGLWWASFCVTPGNPTSPESKMVAAASEAGALGPRLEINYTPEPATMVLLAMGGLAVLHRRK